MDILGLLKQIKKGDVEPLYLIHGSEFFLIETFLTEIRHKVVQGPMADFNYSRKKSNEVSGAQIVAEAKSLPMMAKQRPMETHRFVSGKISCFPKRTQA